MCPWRKALPYHFRMGVAVELRGRGGVSKDGRNRKPEGGNGMSHQAHNTCLGSPSGDRVPFSIEHRSLGQAL